MILSRFNLPNVKKTQWYSTSEIKNYQEKRLRKLIHYSYRNIPYYRKIFDALSIQPKDIQCIEDLKKIPPLSRRQAIENYDSLINPQKIINTHLSSETTGMRLRWAYSKRWQQLFGKTLWRGFSWAGLTPDKRVASFHSRVIGTVSQKSLIIREMFDHNKIEEDLKKIREFKPHFAYCYASAAYVMAQYLLKNNLRLPLEGVIVTSEQLFPYYKPIIEEAFQCKVFNNYGCNDGGAWGAECQECSGFHQDYERSILEFEPNGKMLVTDLWNFAMPLIRYENGDTGQWINKSCPCKRHMPLFSVDGRLSDFIVTPTQVLAPTTIAMLLKHECFADIQLIQHTEKEIEILYVKDPRFPIDQCQKILEAFTSQIRDVTITERQTESIAKPASEKRRISINRSKRTLDAFFNR